LCLNLPWNPSEISFPFFHILPSIQTLASPKIMLKSKFPCWKHQGFYHFASKSHHFMTNPWFCLEILPHLISIISYPSFISYSMKHEFALIAYALWIKFSEKRRYFKYRIDTATGHQSDI
jgi:hypothetical protein